MSDSKKCRKCGEVKPVSEYYTHPQTGDGRMGKCKKCAKKDAAANYRANIERYKEYERGRANLPLSPNPPAGVSYFGA